jgi:hypothetical protein
MNHEPPQKMPVRRLMRTVPEYLSLCASASRDRYQPRKCGHIGGARSFSIVTLISTEKQQFKTKGKVYLLSLFIFSVLSL